MAHVFGFGAGEETIEIVRSPDFKQPGAPPDLTQHAVIVAPFPGGRRMEKQRITKTPPDFVGAGQAGFGAKRNGWSAGNFTLRKCCLSTLH
ncbi:MAG: hypothetical protein ACR2OL_17230 [Anderseniella sp.]